MIWVLLQATCQLCVSGCSLCLALGDGHDRFLTCLGSKHAEVAFLAESSSHCWCSSQSCGQTPLPRRRGGALLLPVSVARVVWELQWWQTLKGSSLLLCSTTSWAANGTCWALYTECTSNILGASGNEGYIHNRDVFPLQLKSISITQL